MNAYPLLKIAALNCDDVARASQTCGGRGAARLSAVKTKQLSLGSPVDWYFKRQSHQLFRSELRRILPIDDCRNNVRRERGRRKRRETIRPLMAQSGHRFQL